MGPLITAQLKEHLHVQHKLHFGSQKDVNAVLEAAGLRLTILPGGIKTLDDSVDCPLRFLGCTFRESKTGSINDTPHGEGHLNTHNLSDLSKAYEVIVATCGKWPLRCSPRSCPMCKDRPYVDTTVEMADFTQHVMEHHSKKERSTYALELADMFRPFLEEKEKSWAYSKSNVLDDFCAELEAAVAFHRSDSISLGTAR
ncbi:hypothetical protein N431DRAFT_428602, partial [Stipitochalara longipes BDJ]